ncbi:sigma 54-interacting transcriptional regulator [Gracilibacillus sp. S3-1-1]|uniref:Sigma 54-interacting transcriptional regulator n=1 Tax=Gracilibacillus pellucidus TaxID=3095368 RepID=A0ACC6M560_9BACI|nr:sigma 54-interacting transcriptional regulator [Gracilibacillus sp. S3-1-1]MDX8046043.1 sigma 54-interacting transcriptional regulator [Gracilibacillus sp. S3-1-1]
MKIAANILVENMHFFDSLPIGLIIVNNKGDVSFMNKFAEETIDINDEITQMPIKSLLEDDCINEVKQSFQSMEKTDRLINNDKEVVTRYFPYTNNDGQLLGTVILLEPLTTFEQRVSQLTDMDTLKAVIHELTFGSNTEFRVVLKDGGEWLTSRVWWEEVKRISPFAVEWVHKLATTAIDTRREIRESYQDDTFISHHVELVSKPIQVQGKLVGCIQFLHVDNLNEQEEELKLVQSMIRKLEKTHVLEDIIGHSPAINIVREQVKLYAKLDTPILIKGEKGTGKNMVAKVVHSLSERKSHPFVTCYFSELLEVSLFEEKLEYVRDKGENGTIYFCINAVIPFERQKQLLMFIEEVSSSIVFSTSLDLVPTDWFMPLYEAIQRYPIIVPALKDRREDIPVLANVFLINLNKFYHTNIEKIDQEVLDYWQTLDWPGNIAQLEREMDDVVKKIDVFTKVITKQHITLEEQPNLLSRDMPLQEAMDQYEKEYIYQSLLRNNFNKTKTAKLLGVSVRNLYYKMDKYKIDRGAP